MPMTEIEKNSTATKLLFRSPYLLLVFLLVPMFTIICYKLQLPFPQRLLMVNNGCLLVCVALRFAWYLSGMRRGLRYESDGAMPSDVHLLERPAAQLKSQLAGSGYRFDALGNYGEKHRGGYLGMALLYGGLLMLLGFGMYDNLMQLSGVVRLGVGNPLPLSNPGAYGELIQGPMASLNQLPGLKVHRMILPNQEFPAGAINIGLVGKDGKELVQGTTASGKSYDYQGYEFQLIRFSYDVFLQVATTANVLEFNGMLSMFPLPQKNGVYTHYARVSNPGFGKISGEAWYNPQKKALKLVMAREGKQIVDSELELWGVRSKTQGGYTASFPMLGQWAEVRVAHRRHSTLLAIGAVIALLGGLIRLAFRPRRVWLEDADAGCRIKVSCRQTLLLLR